jgi:hypothetical protein
MKGMMEYWSVGAEPITPSLHYSNSMKFMFCSFNCGIRVEFTAFLDGPWR